MRTLSAALQAAVTAGNGTPDCKVELIDWAPHYGAVYTGGPAGRTSAVIAADGSLVQTYNDGAGHIYVRRVSDPTQSSWGAWTQLSAAAASAAGVLVFNAGDRLRLYFQSNATTQLYFADSFDNGQTWSAPAVQFDAGAAVAGIAADATTGQVFVVYQVAANTWRVALWSYSGTWSKSDWGQGDSYNAAGIGVVSTAANNYLVLVFLQATATSGYALQAATYSGGVWALTNVVAPADVGAGLSPRDPHVVSYDGLYHCSYGVVDSGSVSGLASARCALTHSLDGVHWSDPLEDGNSYANGAVTLKHAAGYLLAAPDTSALAPPYSGGPTQYRDCTADVVRIAVEQRDGAPAKVVVTLENDAGQYAALAAGGCLRPNARLRLSLGYAGAGLVYTHVGYVDEWSFLRTGDENEVVISASDARAWLERQSRTTLSYSGRSVDWLTREVLARAGLLTVSLPATAQFSQGVARFEIPAGHTWLMALERLSRLYGYDVAARAQANGTDLIAVVEKSPSDGAVWSYGDEVDELNIVKSGDRANHILVYGAPGSPSILGEAWDFADAGSVGQERYLHVLDPEIATAANAGLRATLELNVEKRRALSGRIVAALHPGLELWDVLTASDGTLGPATARVRELQHLYEPHPGTYDIVVGLEGV